MSVIFIISLVLQSTLFSHLAVAGVKPDLPLIIIIFYALFNGSKEGALVGLLGGFLQDLMFGQNLGMNALAKFTVGYLFGSLERKIYKENLFIPMIVVFSGTFLNETILYVLRLIDGVPLNYLTSLQSVILSTAVYNSCLVPFVYGRFYKSSQKGLLSSDRWQV
jgi:rod shape-determining protein MreD